MTLQYAVYVAPSVPFTRPNGQDAVFSPISCTLIYGEKNAVLVDIPFTSAQTIELVNWIESTAPGKLLETVYITHGHGDHWLGLPTLRKRFPSVSAVATAGTIAHMQRETSPEYYNLVWGALFPGQIDESFEFPKPLLPGNEFYLEGHSLKAMEVGHSDTHDTTVLWVPTLKLAVCGDVVYGDVHQMLAEANTPALQEEWVAAIEAVEALKPDFVVAGHKRPEDSDTVSHLSNTKRYIQDFTKISQNAENIDEIYSAMLKLYPNRFNPFVLKWSAIGKFGNLLASKET
ncbi:hypothetical protein V500_07309 [Pseudogymnoascus sp. VKM F-4518 (FW-2643)]|nr:hypothetical protein V500_07309 [Pseudogymnoascus sp. VKM F-4518 (FW-2643)]